MKITVDFSELIKIANTFGRKKTSFQLKSEVQVFEPIDIELQEGREVDIKEITSIGGLLSYQGRQVLLYIKDHTFSYDKAIVNGREGNKFHVAHCKTLEQMMQRNRYQRYVATNNISGDFKISAPNRVDTNAKLWVCQNCLTLLDYKKSKSNSRTRFQNASAFDLKEFFSTYSSCFRHMPKYSDSDNVLYSADWTEVSERVRRAKNFTCETCHVNTSAYPNLCHAHHINGVKQDNRLANLQVLCADCHRKEHEDHMFVSHEHMQLITQLRREQGLLSVKNWDDVYKLTDSAIHGDLRVMQQKGYPAPQIGYQIKAGNAVVDVEVAWPEYNYALAVKVEEAAGWEVFSFGSLLQ